MARQTWETELGLSPQKEPERERKADFMVQTPLVFQPLGTLAVSEVTEGHRPHKRLLQAGDRRAQVSTFHRW